MGASHLHILGLIGPLRRQLPKLPKWVILAPVLLAGILVVLVTPLGLGLREDSWQFATSAESLASGNGLGRWSADGTFRPLTHFPPLYAVLLAGLQFATGSIPEPARWLNAILFAVVTALIIYMVYRLGGSWVVAFAGGLMAATAIELIETFTWLQSEPLYLTLSMAGLVMLDVQAEKPRGPGPLLLAGFLFGLAWLSRYVGIALLAPAVWFVLRPGTQLPSIRRPHLALFLFLIIAPMAVVLAANGATAGSLVDRPWPSWHPPMPDIWESGLGTALRWVLPPAVVANLHRNTGTLALAASTVALGLLGWRAFAGRAVPGRGSPSSVLPSLLVLYFFGHLVVILLTALFFDRLTPLNNRILVPLYLSGLALVFSAAALTIRRLPRGFREICILMLASFLLYRGLGSLNAARELRWTGQGLASRGWHESETLGYLSDMPHREIFTNDVPAIYFRLGQNAFVLPTDAGPAEAEPGEDYQQAIDEMRRRVFGGEALVVILGAGPWQRVESGLPPNVREGFQVLGEFKDGVVFGRP